MKKILSLIIFFCLVSQFFSKSIMSGEKNLRLIQTKYFDIIYSQASENTAEILYENADRICIEIAKDYNFEPDFHFPVVITSQVERFNSYYVSFPYDHIILYDTFEISEVSNYKDFLLTVFTHELTHAFTYNLKNKAWRKIADIFGDAVNPAGLSIPANFSEGAAVSQESKGGNGRLNDEFFLHSIKQAKLENKFPNYNQTKGNRDIYPQNIHYSFGGAFSDFLQKKYGMEKYCEFWFNCVNFKVLTDKQAFYKVYGLSIYDAWKDFQVSFPCPEIAENPIKDGFSKDFFAENASDYSSLNNKISLYSNLKISDKGFYYSNSKNNNIYFVEKSKFTESNRNPKKLLSLRNLNYFSVSKDGRLISYAYTSYLESNPKSKIAIYDTKNKKTHWFKETNLYSPIILENNGKYFLVCTKYKSPESFIQIYKFDFSNGISKTPDFSIKYKTNNFPEYLTAIDSNNFATLIKYGNEFTVDIFNLQGKLEKSFPISNNTENFSIKYLNSINLKEDSKDKNFLSFSWTQKGSMPSLGLLDLENGQLNLLEKDVSGGIFEPVIFESKNEEFLSCIYSGHFYEENRLLSFEFNLNKLNSIILNYPENKDINENSEHLFSDSFIKDSAKYKKSKYLFNGLFLPIGLSTSLSVPLNEGTQYPLLLGFTYVTSNPWSSGKNFAFLSLGYGLQTNSFGIDFLYSDETSSENFGYNILSHLEFDFKGLRQTAGTLNLNYAIPILTNYSVFAETQNFIFYGQNNKPFKDIEFQNLYIPGCAISSDNDKYFYNQNILQLGFSTIKKFETSRFSKTGFLLSSSLSYAFIKKCTDSEKKYASIKDLGFTGKICIPKLLPLENKNNLTYTLPGEISFKAFNISSSPQKAVFSNLEKDIPFEISTLNILFATEIQNTLKILSFAYFSNFYVSAENNFYFIDNKTQKDSSWRFLDFASYASHLETKDFSLGQSYSLKAVLELKPNFGILSSGNFKFDVYSEFSLLALNADFLRTLWSFGFNANF